MASEERNALRLASGWTKESRIFEEAKACHEETFPEHERVDFGRMLEFSLLNRETTSLDLWQAGGQFAGLDYWSRLLGDEERFYVAYLAVAPAFRSRGLGSEILRRTVAKNPSAVWLLDIEKPDPGLPDLSLRLRRFGFYRRNGWHDTGMCTSVEDGSFQLLSTRERVAPGTHEVVSFKFWGRLMAFAEGHPEMTDEEIMKSGTGTRFWTDKIRTQG